MAYDRGILHLAADRPRTSRAFAALLGVLTTFTFEPVGWGLIAPLLITPLLFIALTVSPRDAGGHFFWYGLGLFISGTYWIQISVAGFGGAPWWVAIVLMLGLALLMSTWLWIGGWAISRFSHGEPWVLLLVGPAAWVLIEWLRGWVFTGFPWLALGYSQVDTWLAGWAPVLGVYGASFAVAMSAAALVIVIMSRAPQRWFGLGLVVAPWILGLMLGAIDWTEPSGKPVRTTIIQGGVAQDLKWLPQQRLPTLNFYRSATRDVPDSALVVWPEVAVPAVLDQVEDYVTMLQSDIAANDQTVFFGVLERTEGDDKPLVYNSVVAINESERQIYRKRHLVPYGEYFPVPQFVRDWMKSMNLPYNDLSKGDPVQPLLATASGLQVATAICYEDAYASEMLYAFPDAGLIINVSNDAWFGDSIAAHQHLEIARMRSLETGRPSIRATNTGISAFIDHGGEIVKQGPQHMPVSLSSEVQPQSGATPFVRGGNTPIVVLCALILAASWVRSRA